MSEFPFLKSKTYYEENISEFSEFCAAYFLGDLDEKEELHLTDLIRSSAQLESEFISLSRTESLMISSYNRKKTSIWKISIPALAAAAIFLLVLKVVHKPSSEENRSNITSEAKVNVSIVRSFGNCTLKILSNSSYSIQTGKRTFCDLEMKNLRIQRYRIFPNSISYLSFETGNWETELIQGKHFFKTIQNHPSETFTVKVGAKEKLLFLGTSVYVEKDTSVRVFVPEGKVLYQYAESTSNEMSKVPVPSGTGFEISPSGVRKPEKISLEKGRILKKLIDDLSEDPKQNPNIDWKRIYPNKIQEVIGNKVILQTGEEILVDRIWQDEDTYILERKGKILTYSQSEVKKIQF